MMLDCLRTTAFCIGEEKLGFKPVEIGSKSIRSGACMALFLACNSVEHAKIIGQ